MNPVFQREMRAQARGRKAWRLRLFVAGTAMLGLALLLLKEPELFVGGGREPFFLINFWASALMAIIAPMLTHDLLSRERRDGTLGLLCATPLTAREMVVGKVTAAFSQAVGAWLAMSPVLMLPVLQGGVGHADLVLMFAVQGCVTVCGLGAGLTSSAWNRSAGWALFSGYALLAMVLATLMIPVGVVAASTSLGSKSSTYTLAAVLVFCATLVAFGFYFLAAQEAEHAWTRIQFLGEAGDEALVELGVVTAPVAVVDKSAIATPDHRELPSDGTDDASRKPVNEPADTRSLIPPSRSGWLAAWQWKRGRERRRRDPWLWLVSRQTDPGWQFGWFILGGYLWWLGTAFGSTVPDWPVWAIRALLLFRIPSILREERRTGLMEVLATTPGVADLPRAVCWRMWMDSGIFLGMHAVLVVVVLVFGDWQGQPLSLVTGAASVWAAPWVGLWIVSRTENYFMTVLAAGLGIQGLAWTAGLLAAVSLNRWATGEWNDTTSVAAMVSTGVQAVVQVLLGWRARKWVLNRFQGQALGDDRRSV